MNDSDHRDEIVRLEEQIDELADRIETCRKFIRAGWIIVAGGGVVLVATLVGASHFDLSIMAVAMAAVLGGTVVAGSNRSTAQEATHELTAAEARGTALIEQMDLRLVPGGNRRRSKSDLSGCRPQNIMVQRSAPSTRTSVCASRYLNPLSLLSLNRRHRDTAATTATTRAMMGEQF